MKKYKVVLILVLSLVLLVCSKSKNPVTNPPNLQFESSQSACKGNGEGKAGRANEHGTVIFSSHGDTILVIHQDAFYNCCSEIKVNVTETARGIDLWEYDVGDACKCMCYFDITTMISGLSLGTYLIRYFDVDSNLVDSGVVDIPPKYDGFESSQSGCKQGLGKINTQTIPADTFEDSIIVWSHGDTGWVMHKNDPELCDSKIGTKIERTLEGFDIHEYFIYEGSAFCVCYFDIVTAIYGISPGTYLVRVFYTNGWLVGEAELIIPPK
jgi:hypothetical protein